ncbi:MAG: hypothetical protein J3K34DRAFT_71586 [Monoraphidium minutum]|nr:MAG: hypothetical protein J3K34DRAFT_71586 [Monoraphidium minutum]
MVGGGNLGAGCKYTRCGRGALGRRRGGREVYVVRGGARRRRGRGEAGARGAQAAGGALGDGDSAGKCEVAAGEAGAGPKGAGATAQAARIVKLDSQWCAAGMVLCASRHSHMIGPPAGKEGCEKRVPIKCARLRAVLKAAFHRGAQPDDAPTISAPRGQKAPWAAAQRWRGAGAGGAASRITRAPLGRAGTRRRGSRGTTPRPRG